MDTTQENKINAKEIGYMSYNKLNLFMTALLLGFSISFALLGDRMNLSNIFTSIGDWDWSNIFIIFIAIVGFFIVFGLSINYNLGTNIKSNLSDLKNVIIKYNMILATIISLVSIAGIGHLLLPVIGAVILDVIVVFLFAAFIPGYIDVFTTVSNNSIVFIKKHNIKLLVWLILFVGAITSIIQLS